MCVCAPVRVGAEGKGARKCMYMCVCVCVCVRASASVAAQDAKVGDFGDMEIGWRMPGPRGSLTCVCASASIHLHPSIPPSPRPWRSLDLRSDFVAADDEGHLPAPGVDEGGPGGVNGQVLPAACAHP